MVGTVNAKRRVLGSPNDLTFQLQSGPQSFSDRTLHAHALRVAETLLKVVHHGAPDQATLAAFAARRAWRAAIGR